MSARNILVIGSLSKVTVHRIKKLSGVGQTDVILDSHDDLGGRGGNSAISAYRSSHAKPQGGVAEKRDSDDEAIHVHLMAGVANEEWLVRFRSKLEANGVDASRVEILEPLEEGQQVFPDFLLSSMEIESGRTHQQVSFGTSNHWRIERFEDIQSICGSMIPDLVIVTMELKTRVVEQIIKTFAAEHVDILLSATPGEHILFECYEKVTHLVCNESDAARMLAEEVNENTWSKVCDTFLKRGVQNVVLRLGPRGAYYKNHDGEEGYAPGYTKIEELVDQTGATNVFIGAYASQFVKDKQNWNLKAATEHGNKAATLFAGKLGYDPIPWSDDIENAQLEAQYDVEEGAATKKPPRKKANLGVFPTDADN